MNKWEMLRTTAQQTVDASCSLCKWEPHPDVCETCPVWALREALEAEHPEPVPRLDIHGRVISTAGPIPSVEACVWSAFHLEREAADLELTANGDAGDLILASQWREGATYLRSLHEPKEGT